MSTSSNRLPPPPIWRTAYFEFKVMPRPDRRTIELSDVVRAISSPARTLKQPDGRIRFWYYVAARGKWLRVVTEADGETVHNVFWDRGFKP